MSAANPISFGNPSLHHIDCNRLATLSIFSPISKNVVEKETLFIYLDLIIIIHVQNNCVIRWSTLLQTNFEHVLNSTVIKLVFFYESNLLEVFYIIWQRSFLRWTSSDYWSTVRFQQGNQRIIEKNFSMKALIKEGNQKGLFQMRLFRFTFLISVHLFLSEKLFEKLFT